MNVGEDAHCSAREKEMAGKLKYFEILATQKVLKNLSVSGPMVLF